jgi:hypothetical protein
MNFNLAATVVFILDLVAIFDILQSSKTTGKKALWIVFVVLLPLVGMVIYFFAGKEKGGTVS